MPMNTFRRRKMNMYEVSDFYNVSVSTVSNWTKEGMPHTKKGKYGFTYDYNEIEAWLNEDRLVHSRKRYLIKMKEAAQIISYSVAHTHRLCKEGKLPCYLLNGTTWRLDYETIIEWKKGAGKK